jgi:hypothetical protein
MLKKQIIFLLIGLIGISLLDAPHSFAQSAVYFNDSDPNWMVLGNSSYEIGFRKTNGAIAYITDKTTGQYISEGSRNECLWGAYHDGGDYIGGCHYRDSWDNHFSYSWSTLAQSLLLSYTPDPGAAQRVTAQVTVNVSENTWFDLRLQLQSNWGDVLDYVLFPSDLVFREADIQETYLPMLPGIVLNSAFFEQDRSYIAKYPGELFADFAAVVSSRGKIAIYSLYEEGKIAPLFLGFNHDDAYLSDSTYYYHTFGVKLSSAGNWQSPWVRMRVTQPPLETILAYRTDNQIDRFASLPAKLGAQYTHIVQSPLYKADTGQLGLPFSQYPALLAQVPAPGILHPVGFQARGFDENYPDFLPPDPAWGTTPAMATMFQQAQALNFLVMPYTNPTWWDDESPTLQNLPAPLTIKDIALCDVPDSPLYENYGTHGGYVMSPNAPFVKKRLDQLVTEMTVTLKSNLVFEDQIGARSWLFDYNSFSPSLTFYPQDWLEHTRTYRSALLMTEGGFDRLAETEAGFHGSVLLSERLGRTSPRWGEGAWRPYPMAPLMMRDKVLFYQHDLAPETFTTDKPTLAWNLAFGYLLSYDLVPSIFGGGVNSAWLGLVADFQKQVIARYAGERMLDYENVQGDVTRTSFENFSVITNWGSNAYPFLVYMLPPGGTLVMKNDGSLIAGVFTTYNGNPLSSGDHYLIEERGSTSVVIRQPLGNDTNLTVKSLPGWNAGTSIKVQAFTRAGQFIGSVDSTSTVDGLRFTYLNQLAGVPVSYYKIFNDHRGFIPSVRKP